MNVIMNCFTDRDLYLHLSRFFALSADLNLCKTVSTCIHSQQRQDGSAELFSIFCFHFHRLGGVVCMICLFPNQNSININQKGEVSFLASSSLLLIIMKYVLTISSNSKVKLARSLKYLLVIFHEMGVRGGGLLYILLYFAYLCL